MDLASQPRSGGSMVEIDFRFTVHRPWENVKQCGNRFSDEMPVVMLFVFKFGLSSSRTGFYFFSAAKKSKQKMPPLTNKKLKTVFISLKFSKLLPLVVGQGKFFDAPFYRFL